MEKLACLYISHFHKSLLITAVVVAGISKTLFPDLANSFPAFHYSNSIAKPRNHKQRVAQ